jgi:hypothetical protein
MGMHQYLIAGPEAAGGVRPVSKDIIFGILALCRLPRRNHCFYCSILRNAL